MKLFGEKSKIKSITDGSFTALLIIWSAVFLAACAHVVKFIMATWKA